MKRTLTMTNTRSYDDFNENEKQEFDEMEQDFNTKSAKLLEELKKKDYKSELDSMVRMILMKMPKCTKDMKYSDFCRSETSGSVENIRRSLNSSGALLHAMDQRIAEAKADVKSAKTTTAKKKPNGTMPPPVDGSLRRSSRKRIPTKVFDEHKTVTRLRSSRKVNDDITPLRPSNRLVTPMITPKFDITTPHSKTVMRLAKPNETLVSLSGSPVYSASTAKKSRKNNENTVQIPLGKGKTMILPIEDSVGNGLEIDEESKQKLLQLRTNLDNMLKM